MHPLILHLKTIHKSMKECNLKEHKPKKQLKRFDEYVAVQKGETMDKETTMQRILKRMKF